MSEMLRLHKDEVLFKEGDASDTIYILKSGKVAVFQGGEEIPLKKQPHVIGEISFLEKEPRKATVKAIEACSFIAVHQEHYDEVINELQGWYSPVFNSILKRLKKTGYGFYI